MEHRAVKHELEGRTIGLVAERLAGQQSQETLPEDSQRQHEPDQKQKVGQAHLPDRQGGGARPQRPAGGAQEEPDQKPEPAEEQDGFEDEDRLFKRGKHGGGCSAGPQNGGGCAETNTKGADHEAAFCGNQDAVAGDASRSRWRGIRSLRYATIFCPS